MKTFSTFYRICSFLLLTLIQMTYSSSVSAQCQMACADKVNVSIDPNNGCTVTIAPSSMMKVTPECPLTGYMVKVKYGATVIGFAPTVVLDESYIGKTVEVTVMNDSQNSCWGSVLIEDKSAPIITCPSDTFDIYCFEDINITPELLGIEVLECSNYKWTKQGVQTMDNCPGDGILKTVSQTWRATDTGNGMYSTCTIHYNVLAIEKDDLVFPENDTVECNSGYKTLPGSVIPDPSVTGYPYADLGDTIKILKPDDAFLLQNCGIMVRYLDTKILEGKKYMRTWTINGWFCGTEFDTTLSQVIIISDLVPPILTVTPPAKEVTTNGHTCSASIKLNNYFKASATDACSAATISVTHPVLGLINPAAFTDFPLGEYQLTYIATDAYGNTSTKLVTLTVVDKTPPVAVCIENTVVSLTTDGKAKVPAQYFDNGSKDECSAVTFEVRRMDRLSGCYADTSVSWLPYVEFCCLDTRAPIIIELKVTDASGNSNTCMINVKIQDKLRPIIQCPDDFTIACNMPVALDSASLAASFGTANVVDNCGGNKVKHTVVDGRDKCGVGVITRKWIVSDNQGAADSCVQHIYAYAGKGTSFYVSENPADTTDHVVWPKAEIELEGCTDPNSPSLSPDILGKPIILYDRFSCGNIAINHKDEIYTFNSPLPGSAQACLKILRTWSIIDWCQQESVRTPWTFKQIIKVKNSVAPTITSAIALDTCVYLATCDGTGKTTLIAKATDDCTSALAWTYSIDLGNDKSGPLGGFDIVQNGTGDSINASNIALPFGTHRIVYTFRDLCGNVTSIAKVFSVKNCKKPTITLYEGLALGLTQMPAGAMAVTWAKDFVLKVDLPCPDNKYYIAFSQNIGDTGRIYTCADLGINTVNIYVGVEVSPGMIIWEFATTTVSIQDNGTPKLCPTITTTRTVRGQLITEINANLKDAIIELEGTTTTRIMSDNNGVFNFDRVETGYDYLVKPIKDDDHINGINTLDLLHIQRHILGISTFRSPYKMIAADVDRDNKIAVSDLVALRKLVLHVTEKFENNTSWRFIDKNHHFGNTQEALDEVYNETYEILNLGQNMDIAFTAVKIGDVDGTAATSLNSSSTQSRSNEKLGITYEEQNVSKGEIFDIAIKLSERTNLFGLQYAIHFDPSIAELVGTQSDLSNASDDNFNLLNADRGNILSSWTAPYGESVDNIAKLTFRAKKNFNTSSLISLSDSDLTNEAYGDNFDRLSLEIRNAKDASKGFELYQNTPNPFGQITTINFDLPEAMNAKFTIFDITGKAVQRINRRFDQGRNSIQISGSDLEKRGIYFYTLEAGSFISTKKMVILE